MGKNNKGSALVMVLVIVSLIAILGVMTMSAGLLNLRIRGINQKSDKVFYALETALDEIYGQTGRISGDCFKESYAQVVGALYEDASADNAAANASFQQKAMEELLRTFELSAGDILGMDGLYSVTDVDICEAVAGQLRDYAVSFRDKDLKAALKSIEFEKDGKQEKEGAYSAMVFKGLCLTLRDKDTDIQTSITVDLRIRVPYLRFLNEGNVLFDYALAANEGLIIGEAAGQSLVGGGRADEPQVTIQGNVYGGFIDINTFSVQADSPNMISKGALTIENQGSLSLGENSDEETVNSLWAENLELFFSSKLQAAHTDFYIQDDLTMKGDRNYVSIGGSYYGYGNEGAGNSFWKTPDRSSAIIMNDKYSTVDMENVDSLMLAGRSYLRFRSGNADEQSVYPMGESLAVKAAQELYLVPESDITVTVGDKETPAGSNPVVLSAYGDSSEQAADATVLVTVKIPGDTPGMATEDCVEFQVNPSQNTPDGSSRIQPSAGSHALMVEKKGKLYIYYDFDSEEMSSEYFDAYVSEHGATFESYLTKSGITGADAVGAVKMSPTGQIITAGSLYEVTESGFQLLDTRRSELGSSLTWAQLSDRLKTTFGNLQQGLTVTDRLGNRSGEKAGAAVLPVGNYVNLGKIKKELSGGPLSVRSDRAAVYLSAGDLQVKLNGSSAHITDSTGTGGQLSGGLILSSGNITVTGNGTFQGLIMAGGRIHVAGTAALICDGQSYEALLENEQIAPYFYDYENGAAAVLSDYTDYVTKENWIRAGGEQS